MSFIASLELLEAIKAAMVLPPRRPPFARVQWAQKVVAEGWITLTEFGDAMESEDPRLYELERYMEDLCQVFCLPLRWAAWKPNSVLSDPTLFQCLSATDAAALMIHLECLGFTVAPSALVKQLALELDSRRRAADSELLVLFYAKSVGRSPVVLRTEIPPLPAGAEALQLPSGYRGEWLSRDGRARLEVTGPSFRSPRARTDTTCQYCGYSYTEGDHDQAVQHLGHHRRYRRVHDPRPLAPFASDLALSETADTVTADSPKWANIEMYERARMLKVEMGYDFPQWTSPPDHGASSEEGIGYLLTDGKEPPTIAGACCFRDRAEGWTLDWVWLAPKYRRAGILQKYWARFVATYGDFGFEPPLSEAMQSFVMKHGTEAQRQTLAALRIRRT